MLAIVLERDLSPDPEVLVVDDGHLEGPPDLRDRIYEAVVLGTPVRLGAVGTANGQQTPASLESPLSILRLVESWPDVAVLSTVPDLTALDAARAMISDYPPGTIP